MNLKSDNLLPIQTVKTPILSALETYSAIILSAPPGAGKSTQLPLWLLASHLYKDQKIIMLQPRRIAAKSVASRLAQQLGENVGETVGYRMRNDTKVSVNTRIEVVTEGILTRLIQHDNELNGIGLIIFDEFHERSIHADLAFALSVDIQHGLREDLQLLLMSATLDNEYLANFLPDAKVLACEGRSYPIEVSYSAPKIDKQWRQHAINVIRQQSNVESGSILVFLPGTADIRFVYNALADQLASTIDVFCLYGDLDISQQQNAIAPSPQGRRKVVLATNIAETSLTIDGITLVIDSGLEKVASFNNDSLINELKQQKISKASATQRSGRAGRLQAGKCIRLFSVEDFQRRQEHSRSEIKQADLLPLTIEVARWGVTKYSQLNFLECPSAVNELRNWQALKSLEIVNDNNQLTQHGKLMARFSCHPRFAHMLVRSVELSQHCTDKSACFSMACLLAALLEERDLLSRDLAQHDANIISRLQQLANPRSNRRTSLEYRIVQQAKVLANTLSKAVNIHFKFNSNEHDWPLQFCGVLIAFAYPERIAMARKQSENYLLSNGKGASLAHDDALVGETFLGVAKMHHQHSINQIKGLQINLAAPLNEAHIYQFFNTQIRDVDVLVYDDKQQRITAEKQTRLQQLLLSKEPSNTAVNAESLTVLWCEYIETKGLSALNLSPNALNLIERVCWLNYFFRDLNFPDFSESGLLDNLQVWFAPYVHNIKKLGQLQRLNFFDILHNSLSFELQKLLKSWAPKTYKSCVGKEYPYIYSLEPQPKLALPMQQVYGLSTSPVVANGQVSVLLELLSPAGRPIQVTQDLARFWQGSYKDVQKDMKGRYPKHYWPDDPANAQPTTKTKKYMDHGT